MTGRPMAHRRHAQARRMRRFETERPTLRGVIREGGTWLTLNLERVPGLALMVGCLLLAAFLFSDSRFFVYAADVTGNQGLSASQVYEASGADMHSIFFVAPSVVRQNLLERLPGVEDVRVAVDLPARLHIHVVEKSVRFVWEAGGKTYLADESGTILGAVAAPTDALVIRCPEGGAPVEGQALDPAVLETVRQLSPLLGGQRVFEYSARLGVGWRTYAGWPVYFGVGGDLSQKVAVMQSIAAELAENGIRPQFVDVGVPSRPYYR